MPYTETVAEAYLRAKEREAQGSNGNEPVMTPPAGDAGTSGAASRGYPQPYFDSPDWTPWQRETNARLQHFFRGNFADALAPSFSERFKPGFNPSSVPSSANAPLTAPGMGRALKAAGVVGLGPFSAMAGAEDFLEQALGKQLWDRQDPDQIQDWWMKNTD